MKSQVSTVKERNIHFLFLEERIGRAEILDFHTYLELSLAANNLPLFSRQSKTKLASEASAKVEKKK